MISAFSTAVSGLNAASTRFAVAAENIANQSSTQTNVNGDVQNTPYAPKDAVQISQDPSGVRVDVKADATKTLPVYQPDSASANANGVVQYPDVDVAQQLVNATVAAYDFKANLKTIQVQDELLDSTLDIIS